jgi:hypothetical protein
MVSRCLTIAVAALLLWPAAAHAARGEPAQGPARREMNIVPLLGGDSDVGIGIGELGDWARIEPGVNHYLWRLESGVFNTFKLVEGGVITPYQDVYFLYTRKALPPGGRLQIDVRPAFTNETTLNYYAIGNAAPRPPPEVPLQDTQYGRIHPTLLASARLEVAPDWFVQAGAVYTQNWLKVRPSSLLALQQQLGPPEVRALLGDFRDHGVGLAEAGVQYDSRDNDIVTRDGSYHTLKARVSPALADWMPYSYTQVDLTLRFYRTIIPRWLVLSCRAVGDVLLGAPPFYELSRFSEETPALGGGKAVRGVPAQRYYGKVKVFENLEATSEVLPFTIGKKRYALATAVFLDAGRTWTELLTRHPDLDGTGWGIKYGVGGGLRLQQGETFVIRVDVAWSPDARPLGAYFAAGQIF